MNASAAETRIAELEAALAAVSAALAEGQAKLAAKEAAIAGAEDRAAKLTEERDLLRASHERLRLELELLKRRIFVATAERVDTAQLELEFAEVWEATCTKSEVAREGLARIGYMFALEDGWRREPSDAILRARRQYLRPHLVDFFAWAEAEHEHVRNQRGLLRSALGYAVRQKDALLRVLDDGRLLLEYTRSERELRTIAVGRGGCSSAATTTARPPGTCSPSSPRRGSIGSTPRATCAISSASWPTGRGTASWSSLPSTGPGPAPAWSPPSSRKRSAGSPSHRRCRHPRRSSRRRTDRLAEVGASR
jgi:hypothetical protein